LRIWTYEFEMRIEIRISGRELSALDVPPLLGAVSLRGRAACIVVFKTLRKCGSFDPAPDESRRP
jgi:hypothetical protein